MADRIKVLEIDLDQLLVGFSGLEGYNSIRAVIRWHGDPVGYIDAPLCNGHCSASTIRAAILRAHSHKLLQSMVRRDLDTPLKATGDTDSAAPADNTLVTVAVCTRDRAEQLKDCLTSLTRLAYSNVEILVVDNAPGTDETRKLVQSEFPDFRYVVEPRPGLD